jgi:hypothetical protein
MTYSNPPPPPKVRKESTSSESSKMLYEYTDVKILTEQNLAIEVTQFKQDSNPYNILQAASVLLFQ